MIPPNITFEDNLDKLCKKIGRFDVAKNRATEMVEYLTDNIKYSKDEDYIYDTSKVIDRLKICGTFFIFAQNIETGRIRTVKSYYCKQHLICPICAIRRGGMYLGKYLGRHDKIISENPLLMPVMLTLTVKNGDNLKERVDHLHSGQQRLADRVRDAQRGKGRGSEFAKVKGAVGSIEVTNQGNGWHPHSHAIALLSEEINADRLITEWKKVTGDSFVLNITPLYSSDITNKIHDNYLDKAQYKINNLVSKHIDGFVEVLKYAVKFTNMSLKDNWNAAKCLKGRRMISSRGLYRGIADDPMPTTRPNEKLTCFRYQDGVYFQVPMPEYPNF